MNNVLERAVLLVLCLVAEDRCRDSQLLLQTVHNVQVDCIARPPAMALDHMHLDLRLGRSRGASAAEAVWLHGYMAAWLHGCMTTGCMAA